MAAGYGQLDGAPGDAVQDDAQEQRARGKESGASHGLGRTCM